MKIILLFSVALLLGCTRREQSASSRDTSAPAARIDTSRAVASDSTPRTAPQQLSDDESNWKTYRNERYRFEFKYPPDLQPTTKFSTQDILPESWRAMAGPKDRGTPIVAVPIVHRTGRTAYPRFYDVEFRVGIGDAGVSCGTGNGERWIGAIAINGITFDQYEFSDAAMMKYVSGISYRTVHNGRCFAIEQLRVGSNYRDSSSTNDLSQATLDRYYYLAGKIVKTVHFW